MADYGFKISITGEDVKTASKDKMVLTSENYTFKSFERATTTISLVAGNTSATRTIAHSLAYAPIVFAMIEDSDGNYWQINSITRITDSVETILAWTESDSTNMYFKCGTIGGFFASNRTLNITYYKVIDEI